MGGFLSDIKKRKRFLALMMAIVALTTIVVLSFRIVQERKVRDGLVVERLQGNVNLAEGIFRTMRHYSDEIDDAAILYVQEALTVADAHSVISVAGIDGTIIFSNRPNEFQGKNIADLNLEKIITYTREYSELNWTIISFLDKDAELNVSVPIIVALIPTFFAALIASTLVFILAMVSRSFETVKDAQIQAERANRAKSDFLAVMSHEIRTPMNAIVGITQIQLQKEEPGSDNSLAMRKILSSADSLLGIINDILDLSKVETGKMELKPAVYDLPSLINDAVQLNIVRIGSKPIEFRLDVNKKLPTKLIGDELRIKQILNNLLSNAIKYTEQGNVKLTVGHTDKEGVVSLYFIVEDTGQGLKLEDRERFFMEYSRFNAESNHSTEGTGLGLAITKRLVEMMDGMIWIDSEYGKGSKFMAGIKQRAVKCPPIGGEIAEQLQNFTYVCERKANSTISRVPMPYGSVLVVDDVETNLYVAEGFLEPYRLNVETVLSGYAAIDLIDSGKTYDVIFMDHMMPHMNGIETTKKLRQLGYEGTIVALTANAIVGNDEMFAQHGFNGFIPKPIDMQQLNTVLNKFIRDRYPEEAARCSAEELSPIITDNRKLIQTFRRDAEKAIVTLKETISNGDIKLFSTTAHAMKAALSNVGEVKASRMAASLEKIGFAGDTEGFIAALEELILKYSPSEVIADTEGLTEDTEFLNAQLEVIMSACESYDADTAFAALQLLKEKAWKSQTSAIIEEIGDMLYLNSDFDGAKSLAAKKSLAAATAE